MSVFTKLAASIFAPQDAGGTPRGVVNGDAQTWGTELERIIDAAVAAGNFLLYETKAALDADLAHDANTAALVVGDSTSNDGLYVKSGASGAGSWSRVGDVPGYSFIRASDAGGSANAIAATTSLPINESQLIVLPINLTNTGTPVTVSFNGGSALTIKTAAGNNPVIGGLVSGTVIAGYKNGTVFQMLSDQASLAVQAACEAALADFRSRWVGDFANDAACDAYLTSESLTKRAGTAYFNTTSDTWRYWDGAAWQAIPYATIADDSVTAAKMSVSDAANIRARLEIAKAAPAQSVLPFVYDMHYGVLRGRCWMTGEAGGVVEYDVTSAASAGATSIELTGGSPKPVSGQLLAYLGDDGEYYTVVCTNVSTNTVNLQSPLEADVSTGEKLFNFYINESHPNLYGYSAIADAVVRAQPGFWREVHKGSPAVFGSSTVTAFTTDNASQPGSSAGGGWEVTPAASLAGCLWNKWRPARSGRYRAVFKCNRGSGANPTTFHVRQNAGAAFTQTYTITTTDVSYHVVDFSVMDTELVEFIIRKTDTNAFYVSDLVVFEHTGAAFDGFQSGRHLVFGDSWAGINSDGTGDYGILDRLRDRFPYATFVNKGVGGNQASHLVARFAADIAADAAANGPAKSMLILCGTNDYYASIDPEVFGRNMGIVIAEALALGIAPITLTSSVGSYTESTARFALSRRYATEVAYNPRDFDGVFEFTPTIVGNSTAGAGTYTQQLGSARRVGNRVDFVINIQWSAHTGTGTMKVSGLPYSLDGPATPVAVAFSNITTPSAMIQGYVTGSDVFIGTAASGAAITALTIDTAGLLFISGSYFI